MPGVAARLDGRADTHVAALQDECRSARGMDWLENAWQDVRYAVRHYRRKPALAIAVIALISVGIGATTAVFSVVDRVLFRDPPYGRLPGTAPQPGSPFGRDFLGGDRRLRLDGQPDGASHLRARRIHLRAVAWRRPRAGP